MSLPYAFFGSPEFAANILRGLIAQDLPPILVVSSPDKPVGRGMQVSPSPVSAVALEHGIPLLRPDSVGTEEFRNSLSASKAQLGLVVAFGKIFGPKLLATLPLGFVNIHTSLLPRWRGAGPVQWAILEGDLETGVSLMKMERGLDEGPVYQEIRTPILPDDTPPVLLARLGELAVSHFPQLLADLENGKALAKPQAAEGITYARKLTKEDALLDPSSSAKELDRKIRGLQPWPGAVLPLMGQSVAVVKARLPAKEETQASLKAGDLLPLKNSAEVLLGTGNGQLVLQSIKPPGKKAMDPSAWLRGLR